MKCQWKQRTDGACGNKARLFVQATKGKGWDGYYCYKHGPKIVSLRMRLLKKYEQSVILRPITEWDRLYEKKRKQERKGKR